MYTLGALYVPLTYLCNWYLLPVRRPCFTQHFPLHLPVRVDTFTRKAYAVAPGAVHRIHQAHERFTAGTRRLVIKQVELRHAVRRSSLSMMPAFA